ncbi:alpha/beta hydrolase [Polaribacter sp. HL-MS24]|uniref:alpha/beta hydrolase n=1 Tax=Polaribacter sp. HL-MS24 TaxID=3077735 RepID=UPI00397751C2
MKTLEYIVRQPKSAVENPPLLILLHGYGSNEQDLFSFAEELPQELLIVSARAPYEMGNGGYAWYAINFDTANEKYSDLEQARTSIEHIANFINEIKQKFNTDPNKTFLLGFSQGTILSYALSFLHPNSVNYLVALSGYINEELLPDNMADLDIKTSYYISHGTVDQVIPVEWARKAPPILNNLHIENCYSEYPVGHGVAPQNFFSFKAWIEERL